MHAAPTLQSLGPVGGIGLLTASTTSNRRLQAVAAVVVGPTLAIVAAMYKKRIVDSLASSRHCPGLPKQSEAPPFLTAHVWRQTAATTTTEGVSRAMPLQALLSVARITPWRPGLLTVSPHHTSRSCDFVSRVGELHDGPRPRPPA